MKICFNYKKPTFFVGGMNLAHLLFCEQDRVINRLFREGGTTK
jgi:hypothetical protein